MGGHEEEFSLRVSLIKVSPKVSSFDSQQRRREEVQEKIITIAELYLVVKGNFKECDFRDENLESHHLKIILRCTTILVEGSSKVKLAPSTNSQEIHSVKRTIAKLAEKFGSIFGCHFPSPSSPTITILLINPSWEYPFLILIFTFKNLWMPF